MTFNDEYFRSHRISSLTFGGSKPFNLSQESLLVKSTLHTL